jgi:long-chain fatty acid transport protein
MSLRPVLCAQLLLLFSPRPAAASVGDVFGFGSRASSLAGAGSALVDGFEATYYNPARLSGPPRFSAGFLAGTSFLSANGERQPIEDALGFLLGASSPIPLGGALRDRIHVGIGLFLLPDQIVREIGRPPAQPAFPLFDNRTQRVVVLPAISVHVHPRLSVGIGANVLASLGGRAVLQTGSTRAIDARVDEDLLTTFAFNAGVSLQPTPRWTLALTIRDEFSLPFFTNTTTSVSGSQIDLNVRARVLFEPTTVVLGTAHQITPTLTLAGDLAFKRWSHFPGSFVEVSAKLPLPVGPAPEVPLAPALPAVHFRDIFAVHAGAEWRALERPSYHIDLRGGYAFEPSPVPPQSGVTNLVDGEKHTVAAGAGFSFGSFSVDVHLLWQIVANTRVDKLVPVPFATLEGGGSVLSAGFVWSYIFR